MATTKAFELGDLGTELVVNADGTVSSLDVTTDSIAEGSSNLYHTTARARAAISVSGNLTYDSGTGVLGFVMPTTIASLSNHDTDDLAEGLTNLYFTSARARASLTGGTGITYSSSTGQIEITNTTVTAGSYGSATAIPVITINAQGQITAASTATVSSTLPIAGDTGTDSVSLLTDTLTIAGGTGLSSTATTDTITVNLDNTGVTAGSYGSASQVPVITINAQGQITSASTTAVAGVSSTDYNISTGVLTINTSDGGSFTEDLGVGTADSPQFTQLTLSGTDAFTITNTTARIRAATNLELVIDYDNNNLGSLLVKNGGGTAVTTIDESGNLNTLGNITLSGTVDGRDVAADGTKLDGIESGATADQTASEILTLLKTVDGAGSGLDADTLDGISSASFLRSDANDTTTGTLTINSTGVAAAPSLAIDNTSSSSFIHSAEIFTGNMTAGQTNLVAIGRVGSTKNSGYIGYTYSGTAGSNENYIHLSHWGANHLLRVYGDGRITSGTNTIWHAGNDGAGSGLDADTVDGLQASQFLRSDANDTTTGTITAAAFSGTITTTGNGQANTPFKLASDYNSYMVATAGDTWGLFWAGNSGAAFGTNGAGGPGNIWGNSGNPNEFVFVGGGITRWTVDGNTGNTWQSGSLTSVGNITAGGDVTANSDIRLKSDIRQIENPVETVKQLNGKSYIKDGKLSIGLIAQEVEEVLPHMVHTANDEMGTKSVNYQNMVALLIEAVKEQQKQIEELKKLLENK